MDRMVVYQAVQILLGGGAQSTFVMCQEVAFKCVIYAATRRTASNCRCANAFMGSSA